MNQQLFSNIDSRNWYLYRLHKDLEDRLKAGSITFDGACKVFTATRCSLGAHDYSYEQWLLDRDLL